MENPQFIWKKLQRDSLVMQKLSILNWKKIICKRQRLRSPQSWCQSSFEVWQLQRRLRTSRPETYCLKINHFQRSSSLWSSSSWSSSWWSSSLCRSLYSHCSTALSPADNPNEVVLQRLPVLHRKRAATVSLRIIIMIIVMMMVMMMTTVMMAVTCQIQVQMPLEIHLPWQ